MSLAGWRGGFGGDMVGCYVFQWFIYQFVQGQMQNAPLDHYVSVEGLLSYVQCLAAVACLCHFCLPISKLI